MKKRATVYRCTPGQLLVRLGFRPGYIGSIQPEQDLHVQAFADHLGKEMMLNDLKGIPRLRTRIKRLRMIEDHPTPDFYPIRHDWVRRPEQLEFLLQGILVEAETVAYNPHGRELEDLAQNLPTLMYVRCVNTRFMDGLPVELIESEGGYGKVLGIDIQFPTAIVSSSLVSVTIRR